MIKTGVWTTRRSNHMEEEVGRFRIDREFLVEFGEKKVLRKRITKSYTPTEIKYSRIT